MLAARGFSGVTVIPHGQQAERLGIAPSRKFFLTGARGKYQKKKASRKKKPTVSSKRSTDGAFAISRALAALPEVALSERLGQTGLHLQQLAQGTSSRTLVPVEAPLIFEEGAELEHPIVLLEPLAFLLNRLLEQLCARLASRALATQELRLTLDLDNLTGIDRGI